MKSSNFGHVTTRHNSLENLISYAGCRKLIINGQTKINSILSGKESNSALLLFQNSTYNKLVPGLYHTIV